MCGRYVTVSPIKAVEQRFNVKASKPWNSNTNVSHGDCAPVVASDNQKEVQLMQFGFTPGWAKKQYYMINARAEGDRNSVNDPSYTGAMGILDKPMFRKAIRSQRCLVVADAFIEGPEREKLSKPYVIYPREGLDHSPWQEFGTIGVTHRRVNTSALLQSSQPSQTV